MQAKEEVLNLLTYFDDSSDIPLHEGLNFDKYSEKLSRYAYFVLAIENDKQLGFIAYYLNEEERYLYIPQIVVHKFGRHKGVGHIMMDSLNDAYSNYYASFSLEVLKDNIIARKFYEREGFVPIEDRNEKLLLVKNRIKFP